MSAGSGACWCGSCYAAVTDRAWNFSPAPSTAAASCSAVTVSAHSTWTVWVFVIGVGVGHAGHVEQRRLDGGVAVPHMSRKS